MVIDLEIAANGQTNLFRAKISVVMVWNRGSLVLGVISLRFDTIKSHVSENSLGVVSLDQ